MSTRKQYLKNKKKRRPPRRRRWLIPLIILLVLILCSGIGFLVWHYLRNRPVPEDTVRNYFSLLNSGDYEGMYTLLSDSSKDSISEEDFISRNQNIYEGIEASNIEVTFSSEESSSGDTETVTYSTSMDTCAGSVSFDNQAVLEKNSNGEYRLDWDSTLIFPSLQDDYKVRVETETAERGSIYDRNGNALATQGTVSEVGLVPGKMSESKDADIQKIAELLDMSVDDINSLLGASYVQDDTFVPLKQISKDDTDTESKLLEISGILINDATERVYPLGAAAGHLTGYVQSVTAEELEEKAGEGYHTGSVIGKSGLELAYEDTLRAVDGSSVNIVDSDGNVVETLASQEAKNGEDIYVTIDASLQQTACWQRNSAIRPFVF